VEKVLDVQQREISFLVGTVYLDMKLKPNILNEITKDVRWRRILDYTTNRRLPQALKTD
jgi:hypothetical protein